MRLYQDLTPWYRLVDPPEDHADEALAYLGALERGCPEAVTLLELGAGGGHNARFLKGRYRCTLTDLSEAMLALSRGLNPECDHLQGDMRTLRLGATFDVVLVHDAVMYLTTEDDLRAAIETAFVHLRPGGAAVFAPDCVQETFRTGTQLLEADEGERSVRGLEWVWDPDPNDQTYRVEYVFALKDGAHVETAHDRHLEGVFPLATWHRLFEEVGFQVERFPRPLDDGAFDESFLCRRPLKLA